MLHAISVLSLRYLCAIDGLSCLGVSFALCYLCAIDGLHAGGCFLLCAISVLSLCYRWSVMLGGVFCSALSLCYLSVCYRWSFMLWNVLFALCYLCAISVLSHAISVLSLCYLCVNSVLFLLSHAISLLSLYYLCAIYQTSMFIYCTDSGLAASL